MKVKILSRDSFHLAGVLYNGNTRTHFAGTKEGQKVDFEKAFSRFGEAMQNFGKHIEKNAPKWNNDLVDFGENFEERMEDFGRKMGAWGNDFGERMDRWGKDFGQRMEKWGENVESRWEEVWQANDKEDETIDQMFESYSVYDKFIQLYDTHMAHNSNVKSHSHFYEVQFMESEADASEATMMIGCELKNNQNMPYPIVTTTFTAKQWLVAKMSKDEYKKDWMGILEAHAKEHGYAIDTFFILRHDFETVKNKDIKVYCPLVTKVDDSHA